MCALHGPSLDFDLLEWPNVCFNLANGFDEISAEPYPILLLIAIRIFTLLTLQFPVDAVGFELNLIEARLFSRAIVH